MQLYPILDFSLVVVNSMGGDRLRMLRTLASVLFVPTLPDSAKQAFLARHALRVLAVSRYGGHFVHFEDPGTGHRYFWSILDSLHAAPEVHVAVPIIIDGMIDVLHTRTMRQ